jgi:hypothetical protein
MKKTKKKRAYLVNSKNNDVNMTNVTVLAVYPYLASFIICKDAT